MLSQWMITLEGTTLAAALRSSVWAYPLVNAGHILGVALLVGGAVPLSLRLLGAWQSVPLLLLRRVPARVAAGVSLGVWLAVLILGRLIGYF